MRDADYRGQSSSVDWTKLVHMSRMGKPGALEVLQDVIEIYFPKQFKRAQAMARHDAKESGREIYVLFSGRIARRRFLARPSLKHPRTAPFSQANHLLLKEYGVPPADVVVYSTKTGKDIPPLTRGLQRRSKATEKQQKRARRVRTQEETRLLRVFFPEAQTRELEAAGAGMRSGVGQRRERRLLRRGAQRDPRTFAELRALARQASEDPEAVEVLHDALIETFADQSERGKAYNNYELKVRAAQQIAASHGDTVAILFFPDTLVPEWKEGDIGTRRIGMRFFALMATRKVGGQKGVSLKTKIREYTARRPGAVVTYVAKPQWRTRS